MLARVRRARFFTLLAGLFACDIDDDAQLTELEAEFTRVEAELPRGTVQPDTLVALEWQYAAFLEAKLGRELFVAVGDPPRPLEKFRLPEYEDEDELIVYTDTDKPTCTCYGITSCKSKRWASVCAPNTENCGQFSCSCGWKEPAT